MSLEQLNDEKKAIKKELKIFDEEFKDIHGSLVHISIEIPLTFQPEKADKEAMRTLYLRYRELKQRYQENQNTHVTHCIIKI
jgi:hypothetical protein